MLSRRRLARWMRSDCATCSGDASRCSANSRDRWRGAIPSLAASASTVSLSKAPVSSMTPRPKRVPRVSCLTPDKRSCFREQRKQGRKPAHSAAADRLIELDVARRVELSDLTNGTAVNSRRFDCHKKYAVGVGSAIRRLILSNEVEHAAVISCPAGVMRARFR